MAYLSDFDISGYGLSAQRFRMNVISNNIANANTTRTAEGGPYKEKKLYLRQLNLIRLLIVNLKNPIVFWNTRIP